jgi:hypothetical protein
MTTDPRIDHRARRAAKRVGLVARKSRRRAGTVDNHGGFQLIEPLTNAVVRGERFDMSAEDVLEFCKARDMGDAPVNNLDFTKDLSDFLRQALTECEAKGMKLPFILCAASLNGSVFCIRTAGSDREILAEHYEGGSFQLPINIMVIDQTGEAARIAIEAEGLKFH